MKKAKYITIKTPAGEELLFTFPDTVAHLWMFHGVQELKQGVPQNWCRPYRDSECVGAGFVMDGTCYGRSESLNIDSRNQIDTKLLANGGAA